ncbi:ras-like protein family member 12 [Watersipora subatra]|uniref:ras-like protein family member 12 n=1 Tax=Watersipora subatra TaxID=2589382 RepID=UPI00355BD48A
MPEKFRLVMLGPLGVGKSALTVKYLTQKYITDYDPYIDGKYSKLDIVGHEPVLARVWDTYAHPGSYTELEKYIKWSDAMIVVYSTTSKESFEAAQTYLKHIHVHFRNKGLETQPIMLVGNKRDLDRYREVDFYEGQEMADRFHCLFQESSARGNVNAVYSVFHNTIKQIQQERAFSRAEPSSAMTIEPISSTGSLPKSLSRRSKATSKSTGTSPKPLKKSSSTFKIFNKGFRLFT